MQQIYVIVIINKAKKSKTYITKNRGETQMQSEEEISKFLKSIETRC